MEDIENRLSIIAVIIAVFWDNLYALSNSFEQ